MGTPNSDRFDRLFAVHRKQVFSYFLGHVGCREEALDLLQTAFTRLWRHIDGLPPDPDAERFWLFRTAKNLLTDHYRKAATRPSTSFANLERPSPESIDAKIELELLIAAMNRLPEQRKAILTMSVIGDMSSQEIANALGKPAGTIRYELSKAREQLGKEMFGQ